MKKLVEKLITIISEIDKDAKFQSDDILTANIQTEFLERVLIKLKTDTELRFTILTDLFAADFPSRRNRFEVVYSLLSLELNFRIIIKIHLEDKKPAPSVVSIFSVANWYEREVFDMFGVVFTNHPNLNRILTDYGFVGHPLRKDFPLSGYVQVKYDDKLEQVVYEPVDLEQEFRRFDFVSPWQGPTYPLPGDEKATKEQLKK
jgi:NADH-quinone oxidoreductase subunit C